MGDIFLLDSRGQLMGDCCCLFFFVVAVFLLHAALAAGRRPAADARQNGQGEERHPQGHGQEDAPQNGTVSFKKMNNTNRNLQIMQ